VLQTLAWLRRQSFRPVPLHFRSKAAIFRDYVRDDDDFNKYLDILINTTLNADPKSNETLTTFAMAQGINTDLFTACMKGTKAAARVKADTEEAQKIGAQGTPFSIIVNLKSGKQAIVPGAYGIEEVKAKIESVLK
jgi:protein-disulfide isomerase